MRTRALAIALVGGSLACGEQGGFLRGHEATEVVEISGDVVSRVHGSAIGVGDVERLANVGKLPATTALQRLQAERLLGQEALERGYERQARTMLLTREASVQQLLLADVEPVEVSDRELEATYQAQKARFAQPERRRASHVLAQPLAGGAPGAAAAFIQRTIRALQASSDTAATLSAARAETSSDYKVIVEDLPLSPKDGPFVPEFSRAMFSLGAPGVVASPVHTQFGEHAIVVTEIAPALEEAQSVAFETLRGEIATQKRAQRLNVLLGDLRKRTRVKFAPEAQKILAALDL
jgi:parvulin-like peptidyl-prolyl isomerase